jgi:hypothetical protein
MPETERREWTHQTHPSNSHYQKGCRCSDCKLAHALTWSAWRALRKSVKRKSVKRCEPPRQPPQSSRPEWLQCGICPSRFMKTAEDFVVHMRVMHGVEIEAKDLTMERKHA